MTLGRIWFILNGSMNQATQKTINALAGQIAAWCIPASPLRIMHHAPLITIQYFYCYRVNQVSEICQQKLFLRTNLCALVNDCIVRWLSSLDNGAAAQSKLWQQASGFSSWRPNALCLSDLGGLLALLFWGVQGATVPIRDLNVPLSLCSFICVPISFPWCLHR